MVPDNERPGELTGPLVVYPNHGNIKDSFKGGLMLTNVRKYSKQLLAPALNFKPKLCYFFFKKPKPLIQVT